MRVIKELVKVLDGPVQGSTKADRDRGRQMAQRKSKLPDTEDELNRATSFIGADRAIITESLHELDGEEEGESLWRKLAARMRGGAKAPSSPTPPALPAGPASKGPPPLPKGAAPNARKLYGRAAELHNRWFQSGKLLDDTGREKFSNEIWALITELRRVGSLYSSGLEKARKLGNAKAVADLSSALPILGKAAAHAQLAYSDAKRIGFKPPQREGEFETGWELALRRSAGARALSPQHASAARKRIRAAAAPAFAAALDRAVDAKLLTQFAARHPGGVDARKLRTAYAETANRAFAAEFVRLVGGRPPTSAEDIALGAIIAVAIAQTTARFPIVPPATIAPMAVLVHQALRPRLPELARMAAVIAAAPSAPAARQRQAAPAPAREMAW